MHALLQHRQRTMSILDDAIKTLLKKEGIPWVLWSLTLDSFNCRWDLQWYAREADAWKIPYSFLVADYHPPKYLGDQNVTDFLKVRIFTFKSMMRRLSRRVMKWYASYTPGTIYEWYRRHHMKRTIIARNMKDGKTDMVCTVMYAPDDVFWTTTFGTSLTAGMEPDAEGKLAFVVPVSKIGTSQEAVSSFCAFTLHHEVGKKLIHQYLKMSTDVDDLVNRMSSLLVLADMWRNEHFHCAVMGYVSDYLSTTLNGSGSTSKRLNNFLRTDPVIAEYLWRSNFASEKERGELGAALSISTKMMAGFKKANTLDELKAYLEKKNLLHGLSPILQAKLRGCRINTNASNCMGINTSRLLKALLQ